VASLRPLLIRLLAALLFMQSGVAAAHCLRGMSAGEGMLVEICSTDGMRTMRLDATGEPNPMEPASQAGAFCPVCHGLPAITLTRTHAPAHAATFIKHLHAMPRPLQRCGARQPGNACSNHGDIQFNVPVRFIV